jgi:uncharacterized protein
MPGRGAHVHPTSACLDLALRRRAFGRALRFTGVIDTDGLIEAFQGSSSASPTSHDERGSSSRSTIQQGRTTDMGTR